MSLSALDVLSVATSQLLVPRLADCKFNTSLSRNTSSHELSFAFVEYENRRDSDDAYDEMHGFRMSRDEVLKIEVRSLHFSL